MYKRQALAAAARKTGLDTEQAFHAVSYTHLDVYKRQGVTLVYISNRAVHLKEATLANLRAVGLPVADDSVFLGLGTVVEGCEQHGSEKNCRRKLAGQKYRVLMQFGDQIGDFVQVVSNTREGRDQLYDCLLYTSRCV